MAEFASEFDRLVDEELAVVAHEQSCSAPVGVALDPFEGDHGESVVQVVKPLAMLGIVNDAEVEAVAREADQRLVRALAAA